MASVGYRSASLTEDGPKHLGSLSVLPPEIRIVIYSHLLISHNPSSHLYGKGSGISTAILAVCRTVYIEAVDRLYNTPHKIVFSRVGSRPGTIPSRRTPHPPLHAVARMRKITLSIHYETSNRGECEEFIRGTSRIIDFTAPIALSLLRGAAITSLTIVLLNEAQRKVGSARFRLPTVTEQMRTILLPFAHLLPEVQVLIEGFQTNDIACQFAEMREARKGKEPPIKELLDDALGERSQSYRKKLESMSA